MKYILIVSLLLVVMALSSNTFTEVPTVMLGTMNADAVWGDYDNDGFLDVLIAGFGYSSIYISWLYHNNCNGTFTRINSGIPSVTYSSAAWGDYNNDAYLDILLNGYDSNNVISRIYRNNGNGTFTDINAGLTGICWGCCQWGDYDNDGDLDVLLTGSLIPEFSSTIHETVIYRNNGNGTFTEIPTGFMGLTYSYCHFFDLDNDADLDVILTGGYPDENGQWVCLSQLYRNEGGSTFTEVITGLTGVDLGTIAIDDYDNDGYLDVLLTGFTGTVDANRVAKLFRNDHHGGFTGVPESFSGVNCNGASAWCDYDNDGDSDIVLSGLNQENPTIWITRLYDNDGNDVFSQAHPGFANATWSTVSWGDYDNDHDLDLLLTGTNGQTMAKLYRNNGGLSNTAPAPPSNLRFSVNSDPYVHFLWDAASDQQTPANGLSYNLRIGSTPGGNQIVSAMSSSAGFRRIPQRGNANANCSWKILASALPAHFYWSVQAIDGAFEGSAFAAEQEGYIFAAVNLLTSPSVSFGGVVIEEQSAIQEVIVRNIGLNPLIISNIHFQDTLSNFHQSYTYIGRSIAPGDTASVLVTFSPTVFGAVSDTLFIESNAVNAQVLKILLTGTGTHTPPQNPQNLMALIVDDHLSLSWDAVTQDTHNNPLIPDHYFVYASSTLDPYGQYQYLGQTATNQFIINDIAAEETRFYRISAVKDY
jgi:hypothetical protein